MEEPAHLRAVPNEQAPRAQLGEVLVDRGLLTPGQLDAALTEQSATGRPLGEIVVGLGLASPADLALALAAQHGGPLKTEYGFAVSSLAAAPSDAHAPPLTPQPATLQPATEVEPKQIFTEAIPSAPEGEPPAAPFAALPDDALAVADPQPIVPEPAAVVDPTPVFAEPVPSFPDGQPPAAPVGPADVPVALIEPQPTVPEPAAIVEEPTQIFTERVADLPADIPLAPADPQPPVPEPAAVVEPRQIFAEPAPALPDVPPALAAPLPVAAEQPAVDAIGDPVGEHLELLAVRVATLQSDLSGAHGRIAELETELAAAGNRVADRAARFVTCEHHTVFVSGREGYELHEVHGPPPLEGATITLPDEMGTPGPHVVTRVAASSPDGRPLPCAYLLLV